MIRIVTMAVVYLITLVAEAQTSTEVKTDKVDGITITVNVPNATSDKGTVQFGLHTKETFGKKPFMTKIVNIVDGKCEVIFEKVQVGVYAITCFHDANENGVMDFTESRMPIEDYGISNNPALMGPPTFDVAKFTVENKSLDLTLKF
jgi:uncharacterized protein (DUF2141 family)